MKKKVVSLCLALTMTFNFLAPVVSQAKIIHDAPEETRELECSSDLFKIEKVPSEENEEPELEIAPLEGEEEEPELEIAPLEGEEEEPELEIAPLEGEDDELVEEAKLEVAAMRHDLLRAVKSVEGIEPENDKEEELLQKYDEAVYELDSQITRYEDSLQNPDQMKAILDILDVRTIPVRIQLLIRVGRAIRFGTTELTNKVIGAHTRLAEYVLVGILYILNPFASHQDILAYIDSWEPLEQELLSYPDLQPHDIATIYKKAGVRREITEARRLVRSASWMMGFSVRYLDERIHETRRMTSRIAVTCGELDDQVEVLHEAMERITGPKIRAERIEFMEGTTGYINVDERTRIRPVIFPDELKNQEYIMYSSNSYVCRVSDGEIIPIKPGSVKIIAVALDNGIKRSFDLVITEPGAILNEIPKLAPTGFNRVDDDYGTNDSSQPIRPTPVGTIEQEVTSVRFNIRDIKLNTGETFDLAEETLALPQDAVNKDLTYQSADETIATVTEDGVVHAQAAGEVDIVAEADSGAISAIRVKIEDENIEDEVVIESHDFSNRVAGVFSIDFSAKLNGKRYTGPAKVTVDSEGHSLTRTVFFERGKGQVKFTGFDFGVWRKDFTGSITILEETVEFEHSYK